MIYKVIWYVCLSKQFSPTLSHSFQNRSPFRLHTRRKTKETPSREGSLLQMSIIFKETGELDFLLFWLSLRGLLTYATISGY